MLDLRYTPHATGYAETELEQAGAQIQLRSQPYFDGVPVMIEGLLKKNGKLIYTLVRGDDFWQVIGRIRLDICNDLYYSKGGVGARNIHYGGYYRAIQPPIEWACVEPNLVHRYGYYRKRDRSRWNLLDSFADLDAETIPSAQDLTNLLRNNSLQQHQLYLTGIHLLTQASLDLFVKTVRRYQVAE